MNEKEKRKQLSYHGITTYQMVREGKNEKRSVATNIHNLCCHLGIADCGFTVLVLVIYVCFKILFNFKEKKKIPHHNFGGLISSIVLVVY